MNEIDFTFKDCKTDEDLEHCIADVVNSGASVQGYNLSENEAKGFVYALITGHKDEFWKAFSKTDTSKKWVR